MKILVIEDEVKLAIAIQRALKLQKHVVDVAYDGAEGYDLASTTQYDCIILDVMLPSMDGVTICLQLRQHHIATPIILLTAKGEVRDKVTGLDAGADDYLAKPFAFSELFSRLRAVTRRAKSLPKKRFQASDLVLDPVTFTVTRAGKPIQLSTKEFSILEYLLRHPNAVHSKAQIVENVWSYDTDTLPSTVEVHMKNLRAKVDRPFSQALIKTVRGFGYTIQSKD